MSIAEQDTTGAMQLFEKRYTGDAEYIELRINERRINMRNK